MQRQITAGWGRYPVVEADVVRVRWRRQLKACLELPGAWLAQGNCRSYGDACLARRVLSMLPMDRLLDFEAGTGRLRAEAGVTLERILQFAVPRGWFLPVTPGTKFPTLGGCLAADVHGKNHHVDGSLSRHVDSLEMILADGRDVTCSRQQEPELFRATLGGMGLTGVIVAATLRLRRITSAYVGVRTCRTGNLSETCRVFSETQDQYRYSVAWIDCLAQGRHLGRSLVMLGDHVEAGDLATRTPLAVHPPGRLDVPWSLPGWALSPLTVRAFNGLYYHRQWQRDRYQVVHYDPFFYPLDAVGHWNRIYGRQGFLQYQFVIPQAAGQAPVEEILQRIARSGAASFLAVLKAFGPRDESLLGFPVAGLTLALDIPRRQPGIDDFLRQLNQTVRQAGGRIYLAKDAVLEPDDMEAMYPGLPAFRRIRRTWDPESRWRSQQSDRLELT